MLLIDNELRDRFGFVASLFSAAKTGEWPGAGSIEKRVVRTFFRGLRGVFFEAGIRN